MTDLYEPQRLFESPEAPPELRELLVRAHEDLPSLAERALIIKAATGGALDMARTTQVGARNLRWAARLGRHSTKLLAVAVVGVGVGALYSAGVLPRHSAQAPRSQAPQVQAPQVQAPQIQALQVQASDDQPPVEEERRLGDVEGRPANEGQPAQPTAPRELHTSPAARSSSRSRAHRATSSPSDTDGKLGWVEGGRASVQSSRASGTLPPDRSDTPGTEARPVDTQGNPSPKPEMESRGNSPSREDRNVALGAEEGTLLRSARQSLARSPERTLSLTDEHLRRYPHGILDQEREALAIEALMALARDDDARTRARAFARAYPDSPYRARIEHALARSTDPGARR